MTLSSARVLQDMLEQAWWIQRSSAAVIHASHSAFQVGDAETASNMATAFRWQSAEQCASPARGFCLEIASTCHQVRAAGTCGRNRPFALRLHPDARGCARLFVGLLRSVQSRRVSNLHHELGSLGFHRYFGYRDSFDVPGRFRPICLGLPSNRSTVVVFVSFDSIIRTSNPFDRFGKRTEPAQRS